MDRRIKEVGNRFIRGKEYEKRMKAHNDRINKIKTRKPGSSETLDNNEPSSIETFRINPRKESVKKYRGLVLEQENKAMLQRISNILIAPPKITDEDYVKMHKIVNSLKDHKTVFENSIVEKRNKTFFTGLKKLKPVYNPKQWELDYRRQMVKQRFIRQVLYERPPDFVDPFVEAELKAREEKEELYGGKRGESSSRSADQDGAGRPQSFSKSATCSHVGRVRNVKKQKLTKGKQSVGGNSSSMGLPSSAHQSKRGGKSRGSQESSGGEEEEYNDDDDYGDGFDDGDERSVATTGDVEKKSELASIQREIKVSTEEIDFEELFAAFGGREPMVNGVTITVDRSYYFPAEVKIWLVTDTAVASFVISATTVGGLRAVEAEAVVTIEDLATAKGLDASSLGDDIFMLESLAQELAATVEMRLEVGEEEAGEQQQGLSARLVLSISAPVEHIEVTEGAIDDAIAKLNETLLASRASDEEVKRMLITDRISFTRSIQVPVVYTSPPPLQQPVTRKLQKLSSITPVQSQRLTKPKKEKVWALVKCSTSQAEDKVLINIFFISSSQENFKNRSAIPESSSLSVTTGLPSIMQADIELIQEFFENVLQGMKIEHNSTTGVNSCVLDL